MTLLLDTHAFLWFVLGDVRLSQVAKAAILDPSNTKLVSPATYWEIAIKVSIGKYKLHEPYDRFIERGIKGTGFAVLAIEPQHTSLVATLPFHHRDPFDRLLVAQAIVEQVSLVSDDSLLDAYGIIRVW
jgi:PIN domain nuclease of toxin-antitoxin system